jgi:bifunctional DNA-binding transcriptional regulator/antitoxin component of YhaV-PrlF toxin-antitoxin module
MPLVKVNEKFQATLPPGVWRQVGIRVGDLVEVNVEG